MQLPLRSVRLGRLDAKNLALVVTPTNASYSNVILLNLYSSLPKAYRQRLIKQSNSTYPKKFTTFMQPLYMQTPYPTLASYSNIDLALLHALL